ncbi:hypothetical protein PBOR_14830 [Paenibacillus borealis]|uniref:Uncharacterized protein n=1 Tax=Paenibacillus borealis TaxID=160799 RepID=A0A089L9A5_PAEBO|nr:hypothetical protein PBOR_14830 [Paenibacillus borealis]
MLSYKNTTTEVAASGIDTVIISVGATEQVSLNAKTPAVSGGGLRCILWERILSYSARSS